MQLIYVEQHLREHPRVAAILNRFSNKTVIECDHYNEVFNRKNQHFRQQKNQPALILAEKKGRKVLPTPENFGPDSHQNFYFSHLLNCPFDCRYCFLQGLYRSANYVLFVNYEDFFHEIEETIQATNKPCMFFSGYDADSLAYDPITGFVDAFVPFFQQRPNATLELRSKSANIKPLLRHAATDNVILAASLTPEPISTAIEHKVPALSKRLRALQQAAQHGYRIGLRLDPLIDCVDFATLYTDLIKQIQAHLEPEQLHSVSVGPLRFPKKMFAHMLKMHPQDTLLNQRFELHDGNVSYSPDRQKAMDSLIRQLLADLTTSDNIFSCVS